MLHEIHNGLAGRHTHRIRVERDGDLTKVQGIQKRQQVPNARAHAQEPDLVQQASDEADGKRSQPFPHAVFLLLQGRRIDRGGHQKQGILSHCRHLFHLLLLLPLFHGLDESLHCEDHEDTRDERNDSRLDPRPYRVLVGVRNCHVLEKLVPEGEAIGRRHPRMGSGPNGSVQCGGKSHLRKRRLRSLHRLFASVAKNSPDAQHGSGAQDRQRPLA
mmetsp:Transcript_28853/g.54083  ORF Transcript_28853/g.54083 Transcript_28853/m.54083 type:complete len:216 (+) Transcript_28853:413-1060(+)